MNKLLYAILLVPSISFASPFLVSDPWTEDPKPTHCVMEVVGSTTVIDEAVALDANSNPYCRFDLGTLPRMPYQVQVWVRSTVPGIDPSPKVTAEFCLCTIASPMNLRIEQ